MSIATSAVWSRGSQSRWLHRFHLPRLLSGKKPRRGAAAFSSCCSPGGAGVAASGQLQEPENGLVWSALSGVSGFQALESGLAPSAVCFLSMASPFSSHAWAAGPAPFKAFYMCAWKGGEVCLVWLFWGSFAAALPALGFHACAWKGRDVPEQSHAKK